MSRKANSTTTLGRFDQQEQNKKLHSRTAIITARSFFLGLHCDDVAVFLINDFVLKFDQAAV